MYIDLGLELVCGRREYGTTKHWVSVWLCRHVVPSMECICRKYTCRNGRNMTPRESRTYDLYDFSLYTINVLLFKNPAHSRGHLNKSMVNIVMHRISVVRSLYNTWYQRRLDVHINHSLHYEHGLKTLISENVPSKYAQITNLHNFQYYYHSSYDNF